MILIKSPPSCVSKLSRGNAPPVTKGEIPERNERAFGVGHAKTKTEMKDFKTLNPKMDYNSACKGAFKEFSGRRIGFKDNRVRWADVINDLRSGSRV